MYEVFISVVCVVSQGDNKEGLIKFLNSLDRHLSNSFTDFEIIMINNKSGKELESWFSGLPQSARQNITIIHLAKETSMDNAVIAGLDRSNGDYTLIFNPVFEDHTDIILQLYEETQNGNDMVYISDLRKETKYKKGMLHQLYYWIMKNYSNINIVPSMRIERIISRRALNYIVRMGRGDQDLKVLLSSVGFPTSSLGIDKVFPAKQRTFFGDLRAGASIIVTQTTFLFSLLEISLLASTLFVIAGIINVICVKFLGFDLFGNPQPGVKGEAYLVVFIGISFLFLNAMLYSISAMVYSIYSETQIRPKYIIESIRRV